MANDDVFVPNSLENSEPLTAVMYLTSMRKVEEALLSFSILDDSSPPLQQLVICRSIGALGSKSTITGSLLQQCGGLPANLEQFPLSVASPPHIANMTSSFGHSQLNFQPGFPM